MVNNLELLLIEYDQKRRNAEIKLDKQKEELYNKYPRLEQIETNISKSTINKAKAILTNPEEVKLWDEKITKLKEEKEKYILENKIEETPSEPEYECKICKDTGYIQKDNQKTVMCNCLKQKILNISYNISNLSDIKKESFENFNENLFSDEVDENKYKTKGSPRKNILRIKEASLKFIENFDNLQTKNLIFTGNTGLGKTYMSNCIANELLKRGKTVLYQTAPVLLETIIDNKFNKYKNKNTDEFYNNVLKVDLLIIDDLGTETLNDMKISELFNIINTRILNLNNKPTKTIISTNLSIEQIFRKYEERIGSRIAGYYNIYQFFGEDLRLKA